MMMMMSLISTSLQWGFLWWFWYFSGALLSKNQWVADSGSYAWIQVHSPTNNSSFILSLLSPLVALLEIRHESSLSPIDTILNIIVILSIIMSLLTSTSSSILFSDSLKEVCPQFFLLLQVWLCRRCPPGSHLCQWWLRPGQGQFFISFHLTIILTKVFWTIDVQAILSSVECYDPETDKWTKLVHMKKVGKPLLLLSNIQCLTCRCVASWVECWWTDQSILTPSSTLELICPSFASTCRVIQTSIF